VRCLPEDQQLVEEILPDCIECFDYKMDLELGRHYPLSLQIDYSNPLKNLPADKVLLNKR
jgi:hypothetical protein